MNTIVIGTGGEGFLRLLQDSADLTAFLRRLARVCSDELSGPGRVHCSVMLERERQKPVLVNSSGIAARMDELQYSCGEGPCHDALLTGQLIDVPDLLADARYPRFGNAMAGTGMRSVLGVPIPLPTASHAAATLNCYAPEPEGFPAGRVAKAEELARLAAKPLLLAVSAAKRTEA